MKLYNAEKGKLRKKDLVPWYYDANKKFVEVPSMGDEKEKVYGFLKFCVSVTHPDVTDEILKDVLTEAENRQPALIEALDQLRGEHEGSGDTWKAKAYANAIRSIQNIKVPILSGAQAEKLPKIGKGIAGVIDEVLRHGRLKTQEERMEGAIERQNVTELFLKVWGVTPKIANDWYFLGNRSIEDLISNAKKGNIPKMTEKQKLGLKYFDDLALSVPYDEAVGVLDQIRHVLTKVVTQCELVGPHRRGEVSASEISIACKISKSPTKAVVQKIASKIPRSLVTEEGFSDSTSWSGIVKPKGSSLTRKLVLHFIFEEEWGAALIQLTGPDSFVKMIKEQAAVMGYSFGGKKGFSKLSEIDDNDVKIGSETEEAVFKELGLKIVDPKNRV